MANGDLYEQLVEAMHGIYGAHPGRRALHAKGTWCEGTFTATAEATKLCRAAHLQGQPVTALVRCSNGSGDPESHDGQREVRGMAVKLRPGSGDETDILATTARAHATRTPEDFLEFLKLRRPDPETGQPDMEKLGAFLGEHPEAQPAIQSVIGVEPPGSFATITYFSPHSFKLVDGDGNGTWVRYRWRPGAGEATIPDDEARERGRDYLRDELAERLRAGTVEFDLLLQLAGDDDPIEDPSAVWPDDRELIVAGRLEITAMIDDPEGGGHIEVFDPMRLADGVEPSDDPVLYARPRAYSVSAYERLG
jgi:catalase